MLRLGFATTNPHKLRETEACLQQLLPEVQLVAMPPKQDVPETGSTFEENALIKLSACLADGMPDDLAAVFAEDAGLAIDALDGLKGLSPFPGVYSDRWLTDDLQQQLLGRVVLPSTYQEKNAAVLSLMKNKPHRQARYESWLACRMIPTGETIIVSGTMDLVVAEEARGENGFGYDPIMIPAELNTDRTLAQLSPEEKNRISHRFKALKSLSEALGLAIPDGLPAI